jgi:hypothetical protein
VLALVCLLLEHHDDKQLRRRVEDERLRGRRNVVGEMKRKLDKLEAKQARVLGHVDRINGRIRERRQEAGIIDLEVTGYCDTVDEMTRKIAAAPPADGVSRGDYIALAQTICNLYYEVSKKTQLRPQPVDPFTEKAPSRMTAVSMA